MLRRLLGLIFLLPLAAHAVDVRVDVVRADEAVEVNASAELAVDVAVAWRVLTGYDRYAEFVPGLLSSHVIARNHHGLIVAQRGEARFLFLRQPLEVTLVVTEVPYRSVRSRAIDGSFKVLDGEYELEPQAGGLRVVYRGRMALAEEKPAWLTLAVIHHNVSQQFAAMMGEIERQGGALRDLGATAAPALD